MRDALDVLKQYSEADELSREIIGALIDKVVICDPEHIEIRWKFSDEVMKLLKE